MGILNFNSWIKTNYPECFKTNIKKNKEFEYNVYDHIYIDLNFILHNIIYKCNNQKAFLTNLYQKLDSILNINFATKTVVIAIDGPGPYAKVMLQKKRREGKTVSTDKLNSLMLTPGTEFMDSLEKHLKNYIDTRKRQYKFRKIKFILLPSSICDEGEIKILKEIYKNNQVNENSSHLIVGNDADIIVMGISLGNINNISILLKEGNYKGYKLFDIDKFIKLHAKKYMNINNEVEFLINEYSIRTDFTTLSIMMGNDYVPAIGGANFDKIWESYKETKTELKNSFLMIKNNFNSIFFESFLKKYNLKSKNLQNKTFYNEKSIKNFLQGVLWCLTMYRDGNCKNYQFEINSKKQYACNILKYIEKFNVFELNCPESSELPMTNKICSIVLLPKKALNLVSTEIKEYAIKNLKTYYEIEDCKECSNTKKELNSFNKEIYKLRESNNNGNNDTEIEYLRDKVKKINIKYKEHQNNHNTMSIKEVCDVMSKFNN